MFGLNCFVWAKLLTKDFDDSVLNPFQMTCMDMCMKRCLFYKKIIFTCDRREQYRKGHDQTLLRNEPLKRFQAEERYKNYKFIIDQHCYSIW